MLNFLQYHNAIPIAVSIMLLGAGGVFAGTNPEALYSEQETVLSIDNTYIANKDLSAYTPRVEITNVTEDSEFYYVAYTFYTIDVIEYVWQDHARGETMKVSKADLGQYRDLGVYVTDQLKQIVEREAARLLETQLLARKSVSQKIVSTTYGGLVGKFLDARTETLPGYTPVVVPPPPPPGIVYSDTPGGAPPQESEPPPSTPGSATPLPPAPTPAPGSGDTIPPTIQVLGNNPARIEVRTIYSDLGAVVTDNVNTNLGVRLFLDGNSVREIHIDTSAPGEWIVRYEATDQAGNTGFAERKVIVFNPLAPLEVTPSASTTESVTPPPSETATPPSETQTAGAAGSDAPAAEEGVVPPEPSPPALPPSPSPEPPPPPIPENSPAAAEVSVPPEATSTSE
ncbi:DUF5011 domain-containing protein [Candidatus Uhrbacteria bacterium]|nr:DUF5011 domain-containing protein [Candidatus Uhrbacteria bacterium]